MFFPFCFLIFISVSTFIMSFPVLELVVTFFLISLPYLSLPFFSDSVPNYLHSSLYISFLSLSFTTNIWPTFAAAILPAHNNKTKKPPHIMRLNNDPWSSELLNSHQPPKTSFFAHPCSFCWGQYCRHDSSHSKCQGYSPHGEKPRSESNQFDSHILQSFRTTTLSPQTPPSTLTTEIRECSLVTVKIIHDFRSELRKIYVFISQYLRILAVRGSEGRLRDKLFVMYIWLLCFRKCICAVSLSVPLSVKWEITLNMFYILL